MKDYGEVLEMVRVALKDDTTFYLAVIFTGESDEQSFEQIVAEVAEEFYKAVNMGEHFNMSVQQYLFTFLENPDMPVS